MDPEPTPSDPLNAKTCVSIQFLNKWLDGILKQASTYKNEDNGDESKWSMYNQGRADALIRMEWRLRKALHEASSKE